ncbi:hypothetical protein PHYPSEUDO_013064 [Phytophthora pseudosyringae]|uniref:Sulfatase N-terminal domain-containing protein n=1 Tax=Phytophthora pseudosyringae TaxID=221518 RepID=A0A8T1W7C9_9STRA|nr:hypothetical protein PHYPSEUDO_013064 [Phytophthora pseudosyringae]
MDRMEKEDILNDTIVVIVGDHGQAPEADATKKRAAGLVIEDAVEHYDILNTLADITGLPKEGFVQNGVGRSQGPVWRARSLQQRPKDVDRA